MKNFLVRWMVLTVAVFIVSHISFLEIRYDSWSALLVASFLLGLINAFLRPLLLLLSLPFIVLVLDSLFLW